MTRKDYETIVAAIQSIHAEAAEFYAGDDDRQFVATNAINATAESLSEALAKENPRFDRDKFINACFGS